MYQFKPATPRILALRERIRDRVLRLDSERGVLITEANKKYEHVVPIIKRPLLTLEIAKNMTVLVGEDELIVGNKGPYFFSSPASPEWGTSDWIFEGVDSGSWTLREDRLYHNPDDEEVAQCISPEDLEKLRPVYEYWKERKIGITADAWKPDGYEELESLYVSDYRPGGVGLLSLPAGHLVAGYNKIITVGYKAIYNQAKTWLAEHRGNLMGEDVEKCMFYEAAATTCEAAMTLVKRYAKKAEEVCAACKDPVRKKELEMMADGLWNLSENPARNFWEAVQGIMLYQVFIAIDTRTPAPAFGRFDQYVWPFLKKDLEEGRITEEYAQEIVDAFFLKANCFYAAGPGKLAGTTGVGNTYQHTTLGGVDPETGKDATNPVTYMVLETVGRLKLHDPTISLRFNRNSPDRLWDCAIETSKMVGGLPLYQNDEVIIPGLIKELGYELKDARNYAIIGCQEIVGCGNDYPAPNGIHPPHASILWSTVLNMAINNGINPYNGVQASLRTGYLYDMKSIEEVKDAVAKMGEYIMRLYISINNYSENIAQYHATQTALSISIEGCMESGKDCVCGGAKYNSYGGTATGLATVGDSITTIKYMCFDRKLCTTRQLYDAWMANWEGFEDLRAQIIKEVPHYGNNDPYADDETKWAVELYYDICSKLYSVRSKKYKSGLYGASDHIVQGKYTWATPDGRKAGEPIADAMSPAQSRDKCGPTSVFCSALSFDHRHYMGGIALNMRIHPTALKDQDGMDKLRDMTRVYFENGGLEVQYNVVDTQTLRDAQEYPEKYRDLVVRIAGYSAYFVELNTDLQNDIISRNENML